MVGLPLLVGVAGADARTGRASRRRRWSPYAALAHVTWRTASPRQSWGPPPSVVGSAYDDPEGRRNSCSIPATGSFSRSRT